MHFMSAALLGSSIFYIAFGSTLVSRQTTCPTVWKTISSEFTSMFEEGKGCTPDARAAIRAAFHDCFPGTGGCDGSLILAGELSWNQSRGMEFIGSVLKDKAATHGVGVADIIQFAAAHAIKSCTDGPLVKILIGRKDSNIQAPESEIPKASDTADFLLSEFAKRGLDHTDLTALIGAHTCANQFFEDESKSGASLDSTPGVWDVIFYQQVATGEAPFTFQSDVSISKHQETASVFGGFAGNATLWAEKFVPAMEKMAMLGVNPVGMVDCTSALPGQSSVL